MPRRQRLRANELGAYAVTKKKDHQVSSSTDLNAFDLIIITGFAPNLSSGGLSAIETSRKPILIVSYWNFDYAHHLGLITDDETDYVGTDTAFEFCLQRAHRGIGHKPGVASLLL